MKRWFKKQPKKSLYFLHIPKTAGTSFTSYLKANYQNKSWCDIHLLPELTQVSGNYLQRFSCFHGHFGLLFSNYFNQATDYMITALRDPVELTISLIHMAHSLHSNRSVNDYADPEFYEIINCNDYLNRIINHPRLADTFTNVMTKYLGFKATIDEIELLRPNYRDILEMARGKSEEEYQILYEHARNSLEHMDLILITEESSKSFKLLNSFFKLNRHTSDTVLNMGNMRRDGSHQYADDLTAEQCAKLSDLNKYDGLIYALGLELFQKQVDKLA